MDGLFTRVMLDKSFIQQQITHRSFEPFIRAIQAQISPCCNCIIAGGIDTPEIMAQITPLISMLSRDACGLPFL
ncbi:putative diguanylate phosphodiesterase [Escherichia coli]|uniref:Putative diguanylate phosphodiesterase n=1 Tax=Escherichia coli TaxID=562 RepID=A0A376LP99_ECOLX|nr:putative diguanylate phosphodiesterase [Escherichia coli]